MSEKHLSKITADSQERVTREAWKRITPERLNRIQREVHERYAEQLAAAGFLRRQILKIRVRREIQRELRLLIEREAPPGALYAHR